MKEAIQSPAAAATLADGDYLARYEQRTPGSKKLYDQARRVTPGGISHNHRYHACGRSPAAHCRLPHP